MTGFEAKIAQAVTKVATHVSEGQGVGNATKPVDKSFQSLLDQFGTKTDPVSQKMLQSFGGGVEIHPADNAVTAKNVKVDIAAVPQSESVTVRSHIANAVRTINSDGLNMDKMMEVLTSSDIKMTPKNLLRIQCWMHNMSLKSQMFIRSMDGMKNAVQTLHRMR